MTKHSVFLAFGSNLGDKEQNIHAAYRKIVEQIGPIVARSAFYMTVPEGFQSDNNFVNSVCEVYTYSDVDRLFAHVKSIEKEIGRDNKSVDGVYQDRLIDIDILMYGNRQINQPDLIVPHPRFHLRNFVLEPFAEISPDTVHPVLGKTIARFKDELSQK